MKSLISWAPLAIGFFVLILSLGVAVISVTSKSQKNILTKAVETIGSMGLTPSSGEYSFSRDQTIPVGLVVDSKEASVDGIDVIIYFDPKKVQVVGSSLATTTLFERFPLNTVDNQKGQIRFSALSFNTKPVTGIVGTFSFRPVSKGKISFTFDFTAGSTTDSNLAEHGTAKDILGKVENGNFIFK